MEEQLPVKQKVEGSSPSLNGKAPLKLTFSHSYTLGGITMKNGDYILVKAPDDFPGYKYRGKYVYEHILNYWRQYGIIPDKTEIIHHIDENKHNNSLDNLELKKRSEHTKEHTVARGKMMVELICPGCLNHFVIEKRQSYITKKTSVSCCCRQCIGKYTYLSKKQKEERKRNMFVKEFRQFN